MKTSRVDKAAFIRAYSDGLSYEELGAKFGVTDRYARVLRDRLDLARRRTPETRRTAPAEFTEVVKRIGLSKARRHFSASWATISRWCDEVGMERARHKPGGERPKKMIEPPADWHERAPTMYKRELVEHYGLSYLMVDRLLAATGLKSRPTPHELAAQRPRQPKGASIRGITGRIFGMRQLLPSIAGNDNVDIYGQAARFLRGFFPNVFRCSIKLYINKSTTFGDENGLPNSGRDHFFVAGIGTVHKDELIQIAIKRGFIMQDNEALPVELAGEIA